MRTRAGEVGIDPLPSGAVTFLFTDIEGSTVLLQELGDDAYESTLAEHRRLMREAFEAHGGHEIGTEGDSFFVSFANANEALRATLDAQLALSKHTWAHRPLRVRMGLHTGQARVFEEDYVGIAVHQAARISSAAHGGQVVVSEATRESIGSALPDQARWIDLGEHRLKDLADPVRLFNVAHPGLRAEVPPPRTLTVLPNNLPVQLTSFIGRTQDIVNVRELIASDRLVTLVGAGGAGKTRLALQVVAEVSTRYLHGVWFVELAPLSDPELVVQEIAEALGLRADQSRSIEEVLLDHVRERELLVLLDNCEHLAEAAARAAERLLRSSRGLRVLTTSREPLGSTGECVYRVPSLDVPGDEHNTGVAASDAVRLFCERAAHASAEFALTAESAPHVVEICRRLDGLPLAIELAAARTRMFTLQELAKRLDQRFAILTGGARTGLRRQQTLRATLDWSYDLLSDAEQLLFRRVSVFAGGFTLDAAETICSGEALEADDVVDLLTSLIDRSLVVADTRAAATRYLLLETMREYGRELLAASGEASDVWSRHLTWYADLAVGAFEGMKGPDEIDWLERIDVELDNIRQALNWATSGGDAADGVRLAAYLELYWDRRAYFSEAIGWLRSTMAGAGELPVALRARGLAVLAESVMTVEGFAAGGVLAQECAELPHERGALAYIADAHTLLALVTFSQGDVNGAIANAEVGLELKRRAGDVYGEGNVLNLLAQLASWTGDAERMRAFSGRSLELYRRLGVRSRVVRGLAMTSYIAYRDGDLDEAEQIGHEMLELSRDLGDEHRIADAYRDLARSARERARYEESTRLYDEALRIFRDCEMRYQLAGCLREVVAVWLAVGNAEKATAHLEEARRTWTWTGPDAAAAEVTAAHLLLLQGDPAAARVIATRALAVLREAGANEEMALIALTEAIRLEGDIQLARHQGKRALDAARTSGYFVFCTSALHSLARAELDAGNIDAAGVLLEEALDRSSARGFIRDVGIELELLGWRAVATEDGEVATRLLGAAECMRDTHGFVLGFDVSRHERTLDRLHSMVGRDALAALWQQGRALSMGDALAIARASY